MTQSREETHVRQRVTPYRSTRVKCKRGHYREQLLSPHSNAFPPRRAGLRRRGPRSFPRIAATLRIAGRATRGMPRAPDPGAKTNLRGVAAHAARWGGAGRAPSNPPALGLGFDAWGHSRETRELAGAVGEGATPCTDGRPSENTPAWIASHQSSLPNAAKGYPPREPRELALPVAWLEKHQSSQQGACAPCRCLPPPRQVVWDYCN